MLTEFKVPQPKMGVKESLPQTQRVRSCATVDYPHYCDKATDTHTTAAIPVVAARVLGKEELQDVAIGVWKEAKNDSLSYDPFDAELSINDMAAVAIGMAMAKEYGEVFEIPRVQFESLLWEYADHLAAEKLLQEKR
jgi:hypothetical protein